MRVLVLGSGVVGTASAWYLRAAGHEVTVFERQPGVALETSRANGGQVSVSHSEPWANPAAPLKILRWLGKDDAPLLFRLQPELRQWLWGLAFLRECLPHRTARNIRRLVALGLHSRRMLAELREGLGLEYDRRAGGILHFYTDPRDFEAAVTAGSPSPGIGLTCAASWRKPMPLRPPSIPVEKSMGGTFNTASVGVLCVNCTPKTVRSLPW